MPRTGFDPRAHGFHFANDFPDRAVPSDGTRLADFSHKRLFDSYATWSARHFLTWALAEDHPTWSSPGVNSWTPTLGGNFVAHTARNYGEYRAHLSELRLAVGDQAARWPEEELTIEVTTIES